jgi:hypothetical protein
MSDFKEKERLDALRQRLYQRGEPKAARPRLGLTAVTPVDVARGWAGMIPVSAPAVPAKSVVTTEAPELEVAKSTPALPTSIATSARPRRRYRTVVLLASLGVFAFAIVVSSLYLLFGGNQISGRNIDLTLAGPNAVAGGDVLEFTTTIKNNNDVAMEGVTLVVDYPSGSRSVDSEPRPLLQERLPQTDIAPREERVIPLRAVVFGEENENKQVGVSVDYRVTGSNATFFKEASPLAFTINTSPIVVRVEAVDKISPGQAFDVRLIIESNAEAPLANLLVSATYPNGFRFTGAKPEPTHRDTQWLIEELSPNSRTEIVISGVASGLTAEASLMRFEAGTPRTDNQYIIGALLAQTTYTFTVEEPFLGVVLSVGGENDGEAVLPAGSQSDVVLTVTNTHTVPLYDMNVRIKVGGSAFRASRLSVTDGVYDADSGEIRFEVSGMPGLARVLPGQRRDFRFQVKTDDDLGTGSLSVDASVYARRVSEANVPEELVGVDEATVRFASVPTVERQIDQLSGPVPPEVGKETIYTLTLAVGAGANDVTGAVLTTALPQHVQWLNNYEGLGTVSFNPINKELRWNVGEVKARGRATLALQVGLTPSVLQVGTAPVMMNRLELTATDRFTGSPVQASAAPLTTELSSEAGFAEGNGQVVETE